MTRLERRVANLSRGSDCAKGDRQDRPGGCYGSAQGDEERHVNTVSSKHHFPYFGEIKLRMMCTEFRHKLAIMYNVTLAAIRV